MSETPKSATPEPGQQVYFLAHGQDPPIKFGTVVGVAADRVNVGTIIDPQDPSVRSTQSMPRSDVFSPETVATMAENVGTGTVGEILLDPKRTRQLYETLGAESVASYLNARPSKTELGFIPEPEIVGSETERSSNSWKIRELITGFDEGIYTPGSSNDLVIGQPTRDIELLNKQDAANLEDEIARANRKALNTLYETYGVAFDRAQVLERNEPDHEERLTVYPTKDGKFHFTETVFIPRNKLSFQADYTQIAPGVEIVVGEPNYNFEDGHYLPAV